MSIVMFTTLMEVIVEIYVMTKVNGPKYTAIRYPNSTKNFK